MSRVRLGFSEIGDIGVSAPMRIHRSSADTHTNNAARLRFTEEEDTSPRIKLSEKPERKITTYKWVEMEDGTLLFVTIQGTNGKHLGWDEEDTALAQKIDTCASQLRAAARTQTSGEEARKVQSAYAYSAVLLDDDACEVQIDLKKGDERTFTHKTGRFFQEAFFGPHIGKVDPYISYGGTYILDRQTASHVSAPFKALCSQLSTSGLFQSEAVREKRRSIDTLLKKHAEILNADNTPVQTHTRAELTQHVIKLAHAEESVFLHKPLIVQGGKFSGLQASLFSEDKDVLIPVTIKHPNGTAHAVSIYYKYDPKKPTFFFYDSEGKSSKELHLTSLFEALKNAAPKTTYGIGSMQVYSSQKATVSEIAPEDHQANGTKNCVRYSLEFFRKMIQMRDCDLAETTLEYTQFIEESLSSDRLSTSMQGFARDILAKIPLNKRWKPDMEKTLDKDTPPSPYYFEPRGK